MSALTLAEAKSVLNITTNTYDTDVQAVIDSAEAALAQRVGPLSTTAVTQRIPGGAAVLALSTTPVISLTSVTPYNGTALTLSDLYLDAAAGLVSFNNLTGFGALYYDVAYSAGRTTCPNDLLLAVRELVRHLWQTRRAPKPNDDTAPGSAHLLPYRVSELIGPHVQIGVG